MKIPHQTGRSVSAVTSGVTPGLCRRICTLMFAFVLMRRRLPSFRATLEAKQGTSYLKLSCLCEGRNIRRWTNRIRTLEVIRGLVLLSHPVDLALFHIAELQVNASSSQTFALRPRSFACAPVAHPQLEPQLL